MKLMHVRQDKMKLDLGKFKGELADMKGKVIHIKKMALETGIKLDTAIEAKLVESVQENVIER